MVFERGCNISFVWDMPIVNSFYFLSEPIPDVCYGDSQFDNTRLSLRESERDDVIAGQHR